MKLSQAVNLYVRRKRDAGARFNAPAKQLRSFLRHCGDIDLHLVGLLQVTSFIVRLRRIAGIARHDESSYQPRLHDLRHSFAVHRVTAWYRQNKDVQRLLPALSTYLGHVDLSATQRYLTMTPELLEQANRRFEQYVCGGADER